MLSLTRGAGAEAKGHRIQDQSVRALHFQDRRQSLVESGHQTGQCELRRVSQNREVRRQ